MTTIRKVNRDMIKRKVHLLEQKDILIDNLLNISLNTIDILKNTILSDYDIKINGMTKTLCNFFKFLSLNMCGITELSSILTAFFSFMANLIIPKRLNPIKMNEIHDLYLNQVREEQLQVDTGEYEPLDEESIVNLRKNLVKFMDKLVATFPDTSRDVYPLCDITKYITATVCNYAYLFVPFMVFIRLLTHAVIPDRVVSAIVQAMASPSRDLYEADEFDMISDRNLAKLQDQRKKEEIEAYINPTAPPMQGGNNKKKSGQKKNQIVVYKSRK
jgi:hypothetical protein